MTLRATVTAPSPTLVRALRDRHVGHGIISRALPDELGPNPRAKAQALWHFDELACRLTVQSAVPMELRLLGSVEDTREIAIYQAGQRLDLDLALSCQFTPPADVPEELRPVLKSSGRCYRSRRVVVPEYRRSQWFARKLAARGFAVAMETLKLSTVRRADLGRRGGAIPFVDASCEGLVTDADLFNQAVGHGVGKGRSFGLGLIRVAAIHSR